MPGGCEALVVRLPIVFERGDDPRGAAVEAGGDVLLPVGHEIALGVLGVDVDVDAEAEPGRLRHVFHHLHLRPVIAHPVDVEPFARGLDVGRNAVDQRVLPALGAVDELEPGGRLGAGKRAQMVRDRVEVAIVPIRDPGEAAARVEVHGVGAAAHLGRHQQHPVAEAAAADVGLGVYELALDIVPLRLGVGVAGVPGAMRRDLVLDDGIAEGGGLADRGGAGDDSQEVAPVDPGGRRLDRRRLRPIVACVLFLLVFQKFVVVLPRHLGLAPQEGLFRAERPGRQVFRPALDLDFELWRCVLQFRPARLSHGPVPFF